MSPKLHLENMQSAEENEIGSGVNELLQLSNSLENLSIEDQTESIRYCLASDNLSASDVNDKVVCQVDNQAETWNPHGSFSYTQTEPLDFARMEQEELDHVREKLQKVQKKLSHSSKNVAVFNSLVRALLEVEKLSREIEAVEGCIKEKQVDSEAAALRYSNTKERRNMISSKLSALKCSLSKISSSVSYFVQREGRARHRFDSSLSYLEKKEAELARLQGCKDAVEASKSKIQEAEVDERNVGCGSTVFRCKNTLGSLGFVERRLVCEEERC